MLEELVHILNQEIVLRKGQIKAVGFDLDGTLTYLQSEKIQNLIGNRTLNLLPEDLKRALREISYEKLKKSAKVSVGWYIDLETGYLVLPNTQNRVIRARRGIKEISDVVIAEKYGTVVVKDESTDLDFKKPRFLPICDGFDYVEGAITAALAARKGLPRRRTLRAVAAAVRKAHDDAQRGFKSEMLRNPGQYGIGPIAEIVNFLDTLKSRDYKVFLLTAAKRRYANRLLDILELRGVGYFDKIFTGVKKPACFDIGSREYVWLVRALRRMGVRSNKQVLYVGDHMHKDVIRAREAGFLTCLRLPETSIRTIRRKLGKYGGITFKNYKHTYSVASGQPSEKQKLQLSKYIYDLYLNAHAIVSDVYHLRPILLH